MIELSVQFVFIENCESGIEKPSLLNSLPTPKERQVEWYHYPPE